MRAQAAAPAADRRGLRHQPQQQLLGDDVFYSGTVGAAREATFFGVPAIAVSLAARADLDYAPAAEFARRLTGLVIERGLPERTLLNVNVPAGRPTRGSR